MPHYETSFLDEAREPMNATQRSQINRQNSKKSTGPKTDEGKESARQNAMKHGLCASKLALPGENPEA